MNAPIDQLAIQFATALARDEADALMVAQRAYELADAFAAEQRRRRNAEAERAWERAVEARSETSFEAAGEDPRGLSPAPMTWISEAGVEQLGAWEATVGAMPDPTSGDWMQQQLFEAPGLLDDVPPPPSERLFGQPDGVDELPMGFDEPRYDPRWDAKSEVTAEDSAELVPRSSPGGSGVVRPGLAATRPNADAPAKTGSDKS